MRTRLFVVSLALFTLAADPSANGRQTVDPKDSSAVARITQADFQPLHSHGKVLVVDVRDALAFAAGRIPGSMNVPLPEVERRIAEIGTKAAGRPIVTYCSCPSEHSSAEAGLVLARHGLKDVRALVGGFVEWVRAGGDVERE